MSLSEAIAIIEHFDDLRFRFAMGEVPFCKNLSYAKMREIELVLDESCPSRSGYGGSGSNEYYFTDYDLGHFKIRCIYNQGGYIKSLSIR